MASKKVIILNTAFTYLRTILAALVGLFTARWVLNSLGESDYGLYGLVGSILIFITFLNNVLAGSVARYFAYTIGKKDEEELNKWFNASILIHIVVPLFLIIIGLVFGTIAIRYWFNIENTKVDTACVVFYISIVSAGVTMMLAPFKGLLLAKQDIRVQSIIEMGQSIIHLLLMFVLTLISSSQLLLIYSLMMAGETVLFNGITAAKAKKMYSEIQFKRFRWQDIKPYVQEILVFSSWKSLVGFGNICYTQGQAIVLNFFFGTKINAAYSVASNLSAQSSSISSAMMMAITPEITTREGAGSHDAMVSLSLKASKYSVWLMSIIAIPLFIEVDNLLELWLKNPPGYANILCQAILISMIVEKLAIGNESAINACGRIKNFQIAYGIISIAGVFVTYHLLIIVHNPIMVGISIILCQLLIMLIRLYYGWQSADIKIMDWLRSVAIPCVVTLVITYAIGKTISTLINISALGNLLSTTIVTTLSLLLMGWFLVVDESIKHRIISKIHL